MPLRLISSLLLLGCLLALPAGARADAWHNVLGARYSGPADNLTLWMDFLPQWQRVRELNQRNPVFLPGGIARLPQPYLAFWNNLMQKMPGMSSLQKLRAISGFVNVQLNGKPDRISYGLSEYWASPAQFVAMRGGDCEDFAITKYFALRAIGFPVGELRLLIVEVPSRRTWHALLAARINNEIYIVDNNFRPRDLALPHSKLKGFFILHLAFNEDGAWFYTNAK